MTTALGTGAVATFLVVALLLPVVVAAVTKRLASRAVKATTLVVLVAVAAVLTPPLAGDGLEPTVSVVLCLQGLAVAVAAHHGVLEPWGLTGSTGRVAAACRPEDGVGRPHDAVLDRYGPDFVDPHAGVDESVFDPADAPGSAQVDVPAADGADDHGWVTPSRGPHEQRQRLPRQHPADGGR